MSQTLWQGQDTGWIIRSQDLFALIIVLVLGLGVEMVKKQVLLLNSSPTEGSPGDIEERFPPLKQHKGSHQSDGSDPSLDFYSRI